MKGERLQKNVLGMPLLQGLTVRLQVRIRGNDACAVQLGNFLRIHAILKKRKFWA